MPCHIHNHRFCICCFSFSSLSSSLFVVVRSFACWWHRTKLVSNDITIRKCLIFVRRAIWSVCLLFVNHHQLLVFVKQRHDLFVILSAGINYLRFARFSFLLAISWSWQASWGWLPGLFASRNLMRIFIANFGALTARRSVSNCIFALEYSLQHIFITSTAPSSQMSPNTTRSQMLVYGGVKWQM
jgi:hypothetical protein